MTRKGFRYIITAVAAVAFSTSGCHEFLPEPETRCSDNRSLTEKLLPEFIGQGYRRTVNPCFEFLDIARLVLGLVPERSRRKAGNFELFRAKLIHIVDRLGDVKDIIECGYQRDRLAIGIYQSLTTDWSVGVVIAIRGSTDAFLNVSACFVGKLIRDLICAECASAPSAGPLCADLAEKLPSAEKGLIQGEVLAAPSLNIRKGPGTGFATVGSVSRSTVVYVRCQAKGEQVTGVDGQASDGWDRITLNGVTGYVADAWVDIEGPAVSC